MILKFRGRKTIDFTGKHKTLTGQYYMSNEVKQLSCESADSR